MAKIKFVYLSVLLGMMMFSISSLADSAKGAGDLLMEQSTVIDPADQERPLPPRNILPGRELVSPITSAPDHELGPLEDWELVLRNETAIDPEREYPILGKPPIVRIDPEQERPILGSRGVINLSEATEETTQEQPAPAPAPSSGTSPGYIYDNPRPDFPTGFPNPYGYNFNISELQEWANALTMDPDMQLYVVQLSAGAVIASLTITMYRMAAIGGRQRILAAIIPPEVILDQFGRTGYRVPAHSDYSTADVMAVAQQLATMNADQAAAYVQTLNPELLHYFSTVVYYVRSARALEYLEQCPNPDLCA